MAIEIGDDPDTREWAMHMILVARALERIGDNAVDIGEQVAFVVTGPVPGVLGLRPSRRHAPGLGSRVAQSAVLEHPTSSALCAL